MLYATVRQRKIHVKNPTTVIQNGKNVDELVLDMDDEWKEMTSIVCVFTTSYTVEEEQTETVENEDGTTEEVKKTVATVNTTTSEVKHTFGKTVTVPCGNLEHTGTMSISCTGYVLDEETKTNVAVMTTMAPDSFWTVVQNGPMVGDDESFYTSTLKDDILAAVGAASEAAEAATAANTAAAAANEAAAKAEEAAGKVETDFIQGVIDTALQEAKESGAFDGEDGKDGQDGYTPVKGTDYWTPDELAAMVQDVIAVLPVYDGSVAE